MKQGQGVGRGRRGWLALRSALPALLCCGGAGIAAGACAESSQLSTLLEGPSPAESDGGVFGPDDGGSNSPIQPNLGATVTAQTPPPPISGGTLLVSKDGTRAFAADSDRDAFYVVTLASSSVKTVALQTGDEPGRSIEDGAGLVHVALRGAGAVATIDPTAGTVLSRQSICPAPRGLAYDASTDLVWVACATGELVAVPSTGGTAVHSYVVERDLRDVLLSNGSVSVTQFRSAQVLRLAADGTISRRDSLPAASSGFAAHVAWRAVAGPGGTLAAVHQEESTSEVTTGIQGGYGGCGGGGGGFGGGAIGEFVGDASFTLPPNNGPGPSIPIDDGGTVASDAAQAEDAQPPVVAEAGIPSTIDSFGCGTITPGPVSPFPLGATGSPVNITCFSSGIVRSDLTLMGPDGTVLANVPIAGALPVDVALSGDGSFVAMVTPGSTLAPGLPTVFEFGTCDQSTKLATPLDGVSEPIAVAFASNTLLVQTRQPASLLIFNSTGTPSTVTLSNDSRKDTGHDIFHVQAGGMIACASCHPEGGDDGHVWNLDGDARRTPSLRGTIAGTAPYHWPGDMKDLPTLFDNVYTVRMSGATLNSDQVTALSHWVEAVPAPPAPSWVDTAAAARGKAIFGEPAVGCATCHSGTKFTDNMTVDVGTGGGFQVPPLVGVGWRAPFLHSGCAATLADRFGTCSTPGHGNISNLTPANLSDLEAYLETL